MCFSASEVRTGTVGWVCLNIWKNVKVTYGVLGAGHGPSSYQVLRYHLLGQRDTQRYPFNLWDWTIPVWQPLDDLQGTGGTHLEDRPLHKSSLPGRQAGSALPGVPPRCLWIVSFPRAFTEGCFLSLRGYSYFWLFILSQRKLFSKHRPKDKNLLNVSLHFGTSEFKNLKYVPFN